MGKLICSVSSFLNLLNNLLLNGLSLNFLHNLDTSLCLNLLLWWLLLNLLSWLLLSNILNDNHWLNLSIRSNLLLNLSRQESLNVVLSSQLSELWHLSLLNLLLLLLMLLLLFHNHAWIY